MVYNGGNLNNRFVEYFIRLGAIDEEHSIPLNEVKFRRVILLRRMIARGIFVKCKNNRIYIDLKALDSYGRNSFKTKERLFLAIAILLIIILLTIIYGRNW